MLAAPRSCAKGEGWARLEGEGRGHVDLMGYTAAAIQGFAQSHSQSYPQAQ